MTSFIEQTEVDILKMFEKFVKTDASPLMLRTKLHALLTQYTEDLAGSIEDDHWHEGCGIEYEEACDRETRNDFRAEILARAGLSHGEKET